MSAIKLEEPKKFDPIKAANIVRPLVYRILGKNRFDARHVDCWRKLILQSCLKGLKAFWGDSYKYVVTCSIAARNGSQFHSANVYNFGGNAGGSCNVRCDDNPHMDCFITVFLVSI
ncbi:dynein light chain Tctex-type 3-like [Aethina tumida]|uniref:dynein light chain Tctex-type 3-like n=1 Tax=Aethina tumida TaxID=116153 RepID=UPI00096ADDDC|nr:dynein light chain Tctex-type 3-like [Aethina tumida]